MRNSPLWPPQAFGELAEPEPASDTMAMMSAQPWEPRLARLQGAYEQIDRRLDDLRSHMDAGFAQIDGRFAQIDGRFAQIDGRFAQIDNRFAQSDAQVDGRFGRVDGRFEAIERKIDSLQWRLTALVVGTWATTILAILFHR